MADNRHDEEIARLEQRLSEESAASKNLRHETAAQAEQLAVARAELAAVRDSREQWKRAYYRLANRFPISRPEGQARPRAAAIQPILSALTPTPGVGHRPRPKPRRRGCTRACSSRPGRLTGPKVSLIVLNRDGEAHLRRLVPALVGTRYEPFELIVVDNASSDGSIAYLEAAGQRLSLTIVRNDANRASLRRTGRERIRQRANCSCCSTTTSSLSRPTGSGVW